MTARRSENPQRYSAGVVCRAIRVSWCAHRAAASRRSGRQDNDPDPKAVPEWGRAQSEGRVPMGKEVERWREHRSSTRSGRYPSHQHYSWRTASWQVSRGHIAVMLRPPLRGTPPMTCRWLMTIPTGHSLQPSEGALCRPLPPSPGQRRRPQIAWWRPSLAPQRLAARLDPPSPHLL